MREGSSQNRNATQHGGDGDTHAQRHETMYVHVCDLRLRPRRGLESTRRGSGRHAPYAETRMQDEESRRLTQTRVRTGEAGFDTSTDDTVIEAFRRPRRVTGGVREQCGPRGDHQSEPGRVPRSSDVGATPDASDQQHTLCKQSRAQYLAANKGCTVLILWRSLTCHYTMRPHLTTVPLARSLSVSLSARHDARDGFRGWLFFCSYRVH